MGILKFVLSNLPLIAKVVKVIVAGAKEGKEVGLWTEGKAKLEEHIVIEKL